MTNLKSFKKVVWTLLNSHYALVLSENIRAIDPRTPILIHQMGKVGSNTIYRSLKNNGTQPIFHTHFLSESGIQACEADIKYVSMKDTSTFSNYVSTFRNNVVYRHIITSKAIRRRFMRHPNKSYRVVTLVRDPIARAISEFFELIWFRYPEMVQENGTVANDDIISLTQNFDWVTKSVNEAFSWFAREMKPVFGIDVYEHDFHSALGVGEIHQGQVAVLILQLEQLSTNADKIAQFLGMQQPLKLIRANVANEKLSYSAYRQVVRNLKLPKDIVSQIYNTDMMAHFYSESQRVAMIQKWTR